MVTADSTARLEYLDYVKAICLFFVLMSHRSLLPSEVGAFILPGFFLVFGYTFHASQKGFREYAVKRLKRLLVPFWLMMLLSAPMDIMRAYLLGYGDIRMLVSMAITTITGSFLFPCTGAIGQYVLAISAPQTQTFSAVGLVCTGLPVSTALWFLPAMFSATIIFYFIIKYRTAGLVRDVLTILFLLLMAGLETFPGVMQFPYALGRGFFGAAFMLAGYMLRETDIFAGATIRKQMTGLLFAVPITVFSILFWNNGAGIVVSIYGPRPVVDVFVSFVCGLGSTYVLICLCKGIRALPLRPLHSFLSAAGAHSMVIYLWHLTVYFIGDCIMICIFNVKASPNVFFTECFAGQMTAYRCFMVLFAFSLLTAIGHYLTRRNHSLCKGRISRH